MSDAGADGAAAAPLAARMGAPGTGWSPVVGVVSALLVFLGLQAAILRNVGVFEYPLDDVYIHLAVAEQIAGGGYGVNPGEFSSPASSPLYPLLLTPFAGTEAQRLLPLLWNLVGLAASAALFGRLLWQAGLRAAPALALAAAAPVVLNMAGLAVTGMEHSLHMAASLAIVSGLFDFLKTGRVSPLLVGGIFFAPALRPEGVALALASAGTVALRGRWGVGLALALLGLAPQVAFAAFLAALGLEPMPSSVLTKLGAGETSSTFSWLRLDLSSLAGQALFALTILAALAAPLARRAGAPAAAWLASVAALAGAAHLLAGRVGWLNRYEPYAIAVVAAGLVVAVAALGAAQRRVFGAAAFVVCAGLTWHYAVLGFPLVTANPIVIHLQQAQMARFAHDHAKVPVAVNDLGWVSWTNPFPVLDLWGLASGEARRIRMSVPPPGWAGPLAEAHGVELAMLYDSDLGEAVGADWVPLGRLELDHDAPRMVALGTRGRIFLIGGFRVSFYATSPEAVPALHAALERWVPTLPPGARFVPRAAE